MAGIAGVIILGLVYFALRLTRIKKRGDRFGIALLCGFVSSALLIWDFDRYSGGYLEESDVSYIVEPATDEGASFKKAYSYVQGLAYGTIIELEMDSTEFQQFISARSHSLGDEKSPWMIQSVSEPLPEEWTDYECETGKAFHPRFTHLKHEIDEYALFYCETDQTLWVVSAAV